MDCFDGNTQDNIAVAALLKAINVCEAELQEISEREKKRKDSNEQQDLEAYCF
jgi:hypothetical protein